METINALAQTSGALVQAPIDILNASVATVPQLLLTPLRLVTEGLTGITGASSGLFEGFWGSLNALIIPLMGFEQQCCNGSSSGKHHAIRRAVFGLSENNQQGGTLNGRNNRL